MELRIDLGYDQILQLVKQLPAGQIAQLKEELNSGLGIKKSKKEIESFRQFVLSGPTMTDEGYKVYLETRKRFKKWRAK